MTFVFCLVPKHFRSTGVLVGRPYADGLAAAGSTVVARVMRHLRAEFDLQMALAGYRTVREIGRHAVTRRGSRD